MSFTTMLLGGGWERSEWPDYIEVMHDVCCRDTRTYVLERTCRMVHDSLTNTVYCNVCGERFDAVAQYMSMAPDLYSVTDYELEYKNARFCPNCGAKVVEP